MFLIAMMDFLLKVLKHEHQYILRKQIYRVLAALKCFGLVQSVTIEMYNQTKIQYIKASDYNMIRHWGERKKKHYASRTGSVRVSAKKSPPEL